MPANHRSFSSPFVALAFFATAATSTTMAAPASSSPEMQRAIAYYDQGPTELRRFVHRTRMIYALYYNDVVEAHRAQHAAALANGAGSPRATRVAIAGK
ncbi:MAG: hypothetical protein ABI881_04340 [Betaproteobacteria bacterium]